MPANEPTEYTPGWRPNKIIKRARPARDKIAWVTTKFGPVYILRAAEQVEEVDVGPAIALAYYRGKDRFTWNLSSLTMKELKALKHLIDYAFELAEPVVEHRDRIAQDAYEQGDDSFTRIYRAVPVYVARERPFGEHGEGLLHRLAGISRRVREEVREFVRAGTASNEVANLQPSRREAEDYRPPLD